MLEVQREHKIFENVFQSKTVNSTLSLVTQFTENRLERFQILMEYWKGAISAAIYVNSSYVKSLTEKIGKMLKSGDRKNVGVHLMLKNGVSIKSCI